MGYLVCCEPFLYSCQVLIFVKAQIGPADCPTSISGSEGATAEEILYFFIVYYNRAAISDIKMFCFFYFRNKRPIIVVRLGWPLSTISYK